MTDLEISKALALAIGWTEDREDEHGGIDPDIAIFGDTQFSKDDVLCCWDGNEWRHFDYRDPAVIWPIAKRLDMFPGKGKDGLWAVDWYGPAADTPEKAVAMAVIGGTQ